MYIVIGLGNPGIEYEATRHNVGFMVVERLARAHGIGLVKKTKTVRFGEGVIAGERVVLAEPLTFMNNSGLAARELLRMEGAAFERMIVVYDDLDLEPGQVRVRPDGGSGGHKGIRSIMAHLGNEDFVRVRIGIGRPPGRQDASVYVLRPFDTREWEEIDVALERAADAVVHIIEHGVVSAMNRFNRREEAGV